ncbi:uncharacterized protein LOC134189025 [Corticium candelabrum]|uniref:uncharacterized protein LOC134189025 n=1 Tax=Corticium candelabrum TaxID=121492 RepID=UPI002E25BEEA|nr:uncharacterized protein LOC134189025 [Corticium candelabrum]
MSDAETRSQLLIRQFENLKRGAGSQKRVYENVPTKSKREAPPIPPRLPRETPRTYSNVEFLRDQHSGRQHPRRPSVDQRPNDFEELATKRAPPVPPRYRSDSRSSLQGHVMKRRDTGFESGDDEEEDRDTTSGFDQLPPKSEIDPPKGYVRERNDIKIDLPSSNERYLTDDICKLLFKSKMTDRTASVEGRKRNHSYGIRARTPEWIYSEEVEFIIFTIRDQFIGWGNFEFVERKQFIPPSVSINVNVDGDWRTSEFVRWVFGSSQSSSSTADRPLRFPVQESTYSLQVCFTESNTFMRDLLDRAIAFALTYGIPDGVSLADMFSDVRN